jgi:hypothetical protein
VSPAKISDHVSRRTKPAGLDRLEAALQGIVQSRQLGLGHVVGRIRESEINLPFRQSWRCFAGDAAVLDANANRLHLSKDILPSNPREYAVGECLSRSDHPDREPEVDGAHLVTADRVRSSSSADMRMLQAAALAMSSV